jgi:hypothetical protein
MCQHFAATTFLSVVVIPGLTRDPGNLAAMDCHGADAPRNDGVRVILQEARLCGRPASGRWLLGFNRSEGAAPTGCRFRSMATLEPCRAEFIRTGRLKSTPWGKVLSLRAQRGNPGSPAVMDCHGADAPRNDGVGVNRFCVDEAMQLHYHLHQSANAEEHHASHS